jgi:hypothetical protein
MSDREKPAIKNSWMSGITVQFGTQLKTVIKWAAPFLIAILVVIVFVVTWNRRLGREVTERKLAEEELRKLTRAVEDNHLAVIITDREGPIEYAPSQYTLARMYYKGQGVVQSYKEASKWLMKAAKQGIASAQYNLGVMYANGVGVA